MKPKFDIGDVVVINPNTKRRIPKYILDIIRHNRKRTITAMFYDKRTEHIRYYVGSNKMGEDISFHAFRSDELKLAIRRKVGRPRIRRKYRHRHSKALSSSPKA